MTTKTVGWDDVVVVRGGDWQQSLKSWTDRLPVPGGWLYRTRFYGERDGESDCAAMVFVPDPGRERREYREKQREQEKLAKRKLAESVRQRALDNTTVMTRSEMS